MLQIIKKNSGRQAHQVAISEKNDLHSMQTTQSPEKWVYIDSFRIYSGRQAKRAVDIKKQLQTSKTSYNQWKNSGRQAQ